MELMLMSKFVNWDEVPLVLSTRQVADILSVHINTVKRLITRGELPASKIGRVLRIGKADLKQYLDESKGKEQ